MALTSVRAPFAAVCFLGSFLLFSIELIAAKLLLPRFGATAQVWTVCMMFYQGLLLAGYLYARAALARAGAVYSRGHLVVAAAPLLAFPLAAPALEPSSAPALSLLRALLATVGPAFFALSTTVPVVTRWLSLRVPGDAAGAYALYAASNAGALAALLGYPFLIEPFLAVSAQLAAWQVLYAAFVAAHALCLPPRGLQPAVPAARSSWLDRGTWLLLSLGPSAALLAAGNILGLDFASVPLLWVAPLAVYLLTFILNFKREPWEPRPSLWALAGLLSWLALVLVTVRFTPGVGEGWLLLRRLWAVNKLFFVLASLFVLCMICHRALAREKPEPARSASYYSWIAAGGWAGGLLVGVLLPWLGRRLAAPELDWGLAGLLCVAALLLRDLRRAERRPRPSPWALAAGGAIVLGGLFLYAKTSRSPEGVTALSLRNFYGFYSVEERGGLRVFSHGRTAHGSQSLDPARQGEPMLYFHRGSPIAEVFSRFGPSLRAVGVVGLGVGVLAAYGREGQALDFYELDPDVAAIARGSFSYLARTPAAVTVTTGDGRLRLAAAAQKRYDLLVLDAFTGGAVPVHLLTREAAALYLERLAPGGLIVFNVTNRFLDLRPVLAALARDRGLAGAWKADDPRAFKADEERYYSSWVALSPEPGRLEPLLGSGWKDLAGLPAARRVWTDDYASLWAALGPR